MKKHFNISILITIFCVSNTIFAQISIDSSLTIDKYMQSLIGSGVYYNDTKFNGNKTSIGKFTIGNNPIPNFNIKSGIILSTGFANDPDINSDAFLSDITDSGSDHDIDSLFPGSDVNDAVSLEFNFIPTSDTLSFNYIFASEEYPEFVCSKYNDIFCFLLTGPNPDGGYYNKKNIALIPGTDLPVSINSINPGTPGATGDCISLDYSHLYIDNEYSNAFAYDGFTKVLKAIAKVVPCQQYRIKLVIADLADQSFNSSVFLESNSFSSSGSVYTTTSYPNEDIIGKFATENNCLGNNSIEICFSIPSPLEADTCIYYELIGTAENGIDYEQIPDSITIPKGEISKCIKIKPILDGIFEDTESILIIPKIDNICNLEDTIKVSILNYDSLKVNESADTIICKGNSINIFAQPEFGIQPYTYSWNLLPAGPSHNVTPQTTIQYTYTIKDLCNYSISGEINVIIDSASVNIGDDLKICAGDTVQINAITNAPNILWSTNETVPSINVVPNSDTTISVHVSSLACTDDDTLFIKAIPKPNMATSTNINEICNGEHAIISVSGAEVFSWESYPNDASMVPQGANNDIMSVSPTTTTAYTITGINGQLCSDTNIVNILVHPNPIASFIMSQNISYTSNPTISFQDNSTGNPILWNWEINGNLIFSSSEFQYEFPDSIIGEVPIFLYVENQFGCKDSTKDALFIYPKTTLYIPNAFTPNDDGLNDKFRITGIAYDIKDFSIRIFDRWGKMIYVSNNFNFEWDGFCNGKKLPTGLYTYKIQYKDGTNNERIIFGNISIYY